MAILNPELGERQVALNYQINLVVLDKTLTAIRRAPRTGYAVEAARCSSIGERVIRHALEAKVFIND